MKRAFPNLFLFLLFALSLLACGGNSEPTPTRPPAATAVPLSACEGDIKLASGISDMKDAVEDLDPAIQSCGSLQEFLTATAKYPAALDGADGETFARNRCIYNPSLATTALCKEIQ